MYRIEKGVPMGARKFAREKKYPFKDMSPGDSFLIPEDDVHRNQRQACANSAAYYGKKIATRKVEGGVRVWVVA